MSHNESLISDSSTKHARKQQDRRHAASTSFWNVSGYKSGEHSIISETLAPIPCNPTQNCAHCPISIFSFMPPFKLPMIMMMLVVSM